MQVIDKILLLLLIILLPLGILASRYIGPNDAADSEASREEQIQRVEALLEELTQVQSQPDPQSSAPPVEGEAAIQGLQVSSVRYATASGLLKVTGTTQSPATPIVAHTILFETFDDIGNSAVADVRSLGETVTTEAVMPQPGGTFSYETIIVDSLGRVYVQLHQAGDAVVAGYDLSQDRAL